MSTYHVATNGWNYIYPPRPDSDDLEVLGGATYYLGVGPSVMPGIDIMEAHIHKMRGVSDRASIIPLWLLPKASASLCLKSMRVQESPHLRCFGKTSTTFTPAKRFKLFAVS